MSDKRALQEAQIQSLKDIIKTLESAHPDELAKQWRIKVFEEMMRNKQQHITHSYELRRNSEDLRKLQAKVQELLTTLQQYQANAMALTQDNEELKERIRAERRDKEVVLAVNRQQNALLMTTPQHLEGQFEALRVMMDQVNAYKLRIEGCFGKIRAVRRLRELTRAASHKQIRALQAENELLRSQAKEAVSLAAQVDAYKREIEGQHRKYEQLERDKRDTERQIHEEMEKREQQWKETVAAAETERRRLEGEAEGLKTEIANYRQQISSLQRTVATYEEQAEVQRTEVGRLSALLASEKAAFQSELDDLSRDWQGQLEREKVKYEREIEALQAELSHRECDSAALIEKLEAEVEELRAETAALERNNKDLKRERSLLVASLKKPERKAAVATESKQVQTLVEPARAPAGQTMKARCDEIQALGRGLLDL